jgi:tetratricopeptide (TPR) repeat protein
MGVLREGKRFFLREKGPVRNVLTAVLLVLSLVTGLLAIFRKPGGPVYTAGGDITIVNSVVNNGEWIAVAALVVVVLLWVFPRRRAGGGSGNVVTGGAGYTAGRDIINNFNNNGPQPQFIHPKQPTQSYGVAQAYYEQGAYPSALKQYEKALEEQIQLSGPAHEDVARVRNTLGFLCWEMARYKEALTHFNHALVICRAANAEGKDTAAVYNNIAAVYDDQGDYDKALSWYEKALAIYEKVLGKEHPDTGTTYNNIAVVYKAQGDYGKALEWYNKALAIWEKVLGKEHPSTGTTYNNIAAVYKAQGDYDKALEWYNKDLAICEKVLGKEHPSTATTYNNIACVYDEQGNCGEALVWHIKAYRVCVKALGEAHPNTVVAKTNMEDTYAHTHPTQPFDQWLSQRMADSE